MAITDPLLLPADVLLVPVADLPEEVRRQFPHGEGDFAISRPRSRSTSRVLDAGAAALLGEFRSPRTVVDAVIRYSRAHEADPEAVLEQCYPMIQSLLAAGFLAEEGSVEADDIQPSLVPGEEIAGFEVLGCVQTLEDTELYQVRTGERAAALKIERSAAAGREGHGGALFEREAAILRHLDGAGAPRLLATGNFDGRRWLATDWCPGIDATSAAAELRRGEIYPGGQHSTGLLALCREILAAYAGLHERGVIHGDVHPRNLLVAGDGRVQLVDFGLALWEGEGELGRPRRAGVAFYYEPEAAAAMRSGARMPPPTRAGEQHAVAALVYQLLTGSHYRDFSLEKGEMLRQIAEEPPLPFAERGAEPWPEVEAALARALGKEPPARFPGIGDLLAALPAAAPPPRPRPRAGVPPAEALLARVLARVGPGGDLFREGLPEPPRITVSYGAAGIACGLHRIALARDDAELLALADLWALRAARGRGDEGDVYSTSMEITPETVGRSSIHHSATGVHCVRALIAWALGFPAERRQSLQAFLEAIREPCPEPDLTLGRSGFLLAGSLLLDTLAEGAPEAGPLIERGERILRDLWRELDGMPPLSTAGHEASLGMAHGWAGFLYAALRWCRSAGAPQPERLAERLAELAACARPWGRGFRWRWGRGREGRWGISSMAGWCNGSAGFVYLWTLAHRMSGEPLHRQLAEGAAWNAWEAPDANGSLCCGLAGRAYALLHLHKHGGGEEWLARARELAGRAALAIERTAEAPDSLYKGAVGVAVLAADLARPEEAVFPFFEEEGW
ncbi:MAG: lanthionine synthetase LanC family protein [Thermoanaerobaculia bacterium]